VCIDPHSGQFDVTAVSGSMSKLDWSISIPVETSRPVRGQLK
jgi:hypothetical protein